MFATKTISLICTFPLKNRRFSSLFCLLNLSIQAALPHKNSNQNISFSANIPIIKNQKVGIYLQNVQKITVKD